MNSNIAGQQVEEEIKGRGKYLTVFVCVLFGILVLRLLNMQIFKGSFYEEQARNNRLRIISTPAQRGKILDRNMEVLADSRPAYNVMVIPEDIRNVKDIARKLALILNSDPREIMDKIKQAKQRPFSPMYIARDISFTQMASIESQLYTMPGISIDITNERDYLTRGLATHVLGFLGEISRKELDKAGEESDYSPGDLIGKSGVELICEGELRGLKGRRAYEVDALGRKVRVVEETAPVSGRDVRLTIDKSLELIAKQALGDRPGAVVAMVPATGEILAMASSPVYDPTVFLSPMSPESWRSIIGDPMHPLENRAIRGLYAPGSTFKVLIASLALREKFIDTKTRVFCPGKYELGNTEFRCWRREGHGSVDLITAMAVSCDVYFYSLGERLGIDRMSTFAKEVGLGRHTGIELKDESTGLVPSVEWKRKRFKQPWHRGESVITATGQGFTLVTPLQLAKVMSGIVNGGRVMTPRILASTPERLEMNLNLSKEELDTIKQGLRAVVDSDFGTARGIKDRMFSIGGKTGTAEVARGYISKLPDSSDIPFKFRDHAWFFGFSPVENPEILVVAVLEHGGHGASIAAPIVRDVIRGYYYSKGLSYEQVRQDNQ
ncbi:MAG TPA: penicillin-binding protein 2 [Deltaproteobacteria bacterium]|nr:penicillin-binding protein 2 [Deltaproteobacteria bacterium]